MKLSEDNKEIFLINLTESLVEHASATANLIQRGETDRMIVYPPNGGFTSEEVDELRKLNVNEPLKEALRKILASNTAEVIFSLLNMIDGTSDPHLASGNWTEVMLVDFEEETDTEMLHDDFFSSYWDWREKTKNKKWKLDLLNDE